MSMIRLPERKTVRPTTAAKVRQNQLRVEAERYGLPYQQYLHMMHLAATTGKLPVFDLEGSPLEETEWDHISAKDRLGLVSKLVDKVMPDKAPESTKLETANTTAIAEDIENATHRQKNNDQLRALLEAPAEVYASDTEFSEI